MQIIVEQTSDDVANTAASWVAALLVKKRNAVLGLATGSTPIKLYEKMVQKYQQGNVSFKDVTSFNLDEYYDIEPNNPQSYRSFMNGKLFNHVDIELENTFLPTCTAEQDPHLQGLWYEKLIAEKGGIDLQILGIGSNGHIGFNEPASSLASRTRIKTLTQQTIQDNSRLFAPNEYQPELAMTMGIGTIMDARYVILMATGEHKAEAVKQMVNGSVSASCPASVLQMHPNTIILLDQGAASALDQRTYFDWAHQQNSKIHQKFGYFHQL